MTGCYICHEGPTRVLKRSQPFVCEACKVRHDLGEITQVSLTQVGCTQDSRDAAK